MRTISSEQLKEILRSHKKWLNGKNGVRANLCEVDLRGANLHGADLRRADLRNVDLREANLHGADLRRADLRKANLHWADLCRADLREADLREADLRFTNLRGANLREANIRGAYLCDAILRKADLRSADLREANLREADFSEAKIDMDVFIKICPLCCPETGAFVGWMKAGGHIVKLRIPEDALRSSVTTNMYRCSKAKILAIENLDGSVADVRKVSSDFDSSLVYEVGKTIEVKNFDRDRKSEYIPGFRFFCTRQEAVEY